MEEFIYVKENFIEVLFPLPLNRTFTYKIPSDVVIQKGTFVRARFGGRSCVGVVWHLLENQEDFPGDIKDKIKNIEEIISLAPLPNSLCDLIDWTARYTLSPLGSVLKLAMGEASLFKKNLPKKSLKKPLNKKKEIKTNPEITHRAFRSFSLTTDQNFALQSLQKIFKKNSFSVSLLDGVTGSGKTEVYFEGIEIILKKRGQILVLLPEISLNAQWIIRFENRFGFKPFVWHSDLKVSSRKECWAEVSSGKPIVVVGARSALFLPFPNLQFIVVDEEHETSFKQEEGVFYNARDMAIVRAKIEDIPLLLVSATPSLESRVNAKSGRYHLLHLPHRPLGVALPKIEAIDMRLYGKELRAIGRKEGRTPYLSPPLRQALFDVWKSSEQSLLFLNRRGYAPLTLCRGCGYRFSCPNCSAWLVKHQRSDTLLCHHCGYHLKYPSQCPGCQAEDMFAACGPGVERIAEEVSTFMPEARVCLLSSDTLSSPHKIESVMADILKGEVDILIGTQVIAKGHHFPNLTLVGIVDADLGLTGGDLRASERTYQVLHQVSGRSGREEKKGRVLIQTFCPEHAVMKALISGDRDRFMEEEEYARQKNKMPPFGRLAALIISSINPKEAESIARMLGKTTPICPDIVIFGPTPAPLFQLGRRYRWRFLIKSSKTAPLHGMIESWLKTVKIPKTSKVHVDIDPYSFM